MNKNIHTTTLKDLAVLEALTDDDFAARTTEELAAKLQRSYDSVYASLNTLRTAEYVKQNGSRWQLTARLGMFAKDFITAAENSR